MAKVCVYIASDDGFESVRSTLRPYSDDMVVGRVSGLSEGQGFFERLAETMIANAGEVDMLVISLSDVAAELRGTRNALAAVRTLVRAGVPGVVHMVVVDDYGGIQGKWLDTLPRAGVEVVGGLEDIGGVFAKAFHEEDPSETSTVHVEHERKLPSLYGRGHDDENAKAISAGLDLYEQEDPFADAAGIDDEDPFVSITDSMRLPEVADDDGDGEDYDPFADAPTVEPEDDGGVGLTDFLAMHGIGTDEGEDGDGEADGHRTRGEMEALAELVINPEPAWSYDLIDEAQSKPGSSLFKSRNLKQKMGEVKPTALATSVYIPRQQQLQGGAYTASTNSKIIAVYSACGGTGKTTVASMVGVQLNWYFNKEVMQQRSSSWTTRVLVLSLNEFDDMSVKGIGYENPMGNDSDRKNIAELRSRIHDCGGQPNWDDIADCFAASTENYVYYLPSITLKDRLETGIEISAADYKQIIEVCSRFFGFIILDMPDIMYDQKDGLVEFALNQADVVVYVMEPNTKNTFMLFQLVAGLRDADGNLAIDKEKWMLVVNKYAKADSPYLGYVDDPQNYGQVSMTAITESVSRFFFAIRAIPLTSRRSSGNILFGRDPHVKTAARDITDVILEQLDANESKATKVKHRKSRR